MKKSREANTSKKTAVKKRKISAPDSTAEKIIVPVDLKVDFLRLCDVPQGATEASIRQHFSIVGCEPICVTFKNKTARDGSSTSSSSSSSSQQAIIKFQDASVCQKAYRAAPSVLKGKTVTWQLVTNVEAMNESDYSSNKESSSSFTSLVKPSVADQSEHKITLGQSVSFHTPDVDSRYSKLRFVDYALTSGNLSDRLLSVCKSKLLSNSSCPFPTKVISFPAPLIPFRDGLVSFKTQEDAIRATDFFLANKEAESEQYFSSDLVSTSPILLKEVFCHKTQWLCAVCGVYNDVSQKEREWCPVCCTSVSHADTLKIFSC